MPARSYAVALLHDVPIDKCQLRPSRLVRSYPSGWQIFLAREGQQQPELLTVLVCADCLVWCLDEFPCVCWSARTEI